MNDPIVVWPPGSYYYDCWTMTGGTYFDCTYNYPYLAAYGAVACCPAW